MDLDTAKSLLLPIHAAFGGLAIRVGGGTLVGRVGSSAFIAFNLWGGLRGQLLGLAGAGIGLLGLLMARSHQRPLADPAAAPKTGAQHPGATMGGAFAAADTDATPELPEAAELRLGVSR